MNHIWNCGSSLLLCINIINYINSWLKDNSSEISIVTSAMDFSWYIFQILICNLGVSTLLTHTDVPNDIAISFQSNIRKCRGVCVCVRLILKYKY